MVGVTPYLIVVYSLVMSAERWWIGVHDLVHDQQRGEAKKANHDVAFPRHLNKRPVKVKLWPANEERQSNNYREVRPPCTTRSCASDSQTQCALGEWKILHHSWHILGCKLCGL